MECMEISLENLYVHNGTKGLKRLCQHSLVHFVYNTSYVSLITMKLENWLVNDKITAFCQTHNYVSWVLHLLLQTTKMNFEKLLG